MSTIRITDVDVRDGIGNAYVADAITLQGLSGGVELGYFPNGLPYFSGAITPDPTNSDTFVASHVTLTNANDGFSLEGNSGIKVLYGAGGEDHLSSSPDGPGITLDGGNNNDVLVGLSPEKDILLGQNDNDTLIMDGQDEATGGAGADRFLLTDLTGGSAFITDLQSVAGKNHDIVDLWQPLHDAGYDYNTFTEAKNAGTIGVSYSHGYTYLSFDTNGDHVPDHEFAHIKGVVTSDLFDSTFKVSYLDSYSHTRLAGDDLLDGTVNPGRDHLLGAGGNDTYIMDSQDVATGGPGADRFVLTVGPGYPIIYDMQATGTDHDVIDLWKPLHDNGYSYSSFSEAEAAGTLGISYDHGYTDITFDTNGDHVPDAPIVHMKGVVIVPPDQIDQVYLVSYEDSYYHHAGLV